MSPYRKEPQSTFVGASGAEEPPDIPRLREKEEEEKKGGAIGPWAGSGGSGLTINGATGARVGVTLSRASQPIIGRIAAALSQMFGGPGTFLGALFASQFGQVLVLGGLAAWSAVLGAGAYALWRSMPYSPAAPAPSFPVVDSIAPAAPAVREAKGNSLDFLGKANRGALADKENSPAPAPPKEEKKEAPKEPPKVEAPKAPAIQTPAAPPPRLQGGFGFNNKGFAQGAFGGAGGGAPKLAQGDGFSTAKTFSPSGVGAKPLNGFSRPMTTQGVRTATTQKAVSGRAMGQLKFTSAASRDGDYAAAPAASRQLSTDAFEQGKSKGGADALGVTDPGGAVVPPGSGAANPDVNNSIPQVPFGQNVTPYQPAVDNAKNNTNAAVALLIAGIILIILGLMLVLLGLGMLNCTEMPIGLALIAIGMIMIIIGMILMAIAAMLFAMGHNNANNVGQQQGQQQQGQTANDCINQAQSTMQNVDTVCPQGGTNFNPSQGNNVHQATTAESNAPIAH